MTNWRATLLRRARLTDACAHDIAVREQEYARCKADPVHWINTWGWTYDPRRLDEMGGLLPFELFDRQAELVRWAQGLMVDKNNGLVEKCRDVGATWVITALLVHGWLFRPGFAAGIGSRKEDLVDRLGDPKCIFEKARQLVANLPAWMRPEGYNPKKHAPHLKLVNPMTGATITGEAGDNIGRGGRTTIYLVDEFAFLPRAQTAEAALSQNTDTIIYLSTPNGVGNRFYDVRHKGNVPVFTFRWDQDPRKVAYESHDGLGFLEDFERKYGPTTLAQEILIDYAASIDNVVIPAKWVRAAVGFELPDAHEVVAGLDVADGGADENALIVRRGGRVEHVETWAGEAHAAGRRAHAACIAHEVHRLVYDRDGVGSAVAGVMSDARPRYQHEGIRGGTSPTETTYTDDPRLPANERFRNRRAEMWWSLRIRFWKTWRVVHERAAYDPAELISIPEDDTLISQLSQPQFEVAEDGRIKLKSKEQMRREGVSSPDRADALVYSFAPTSGPWWVGMSSRT